MVRPIAIRKAFTTVVSARKNVVVLKENKPGKTAAIGAGIVGLGATLAAPFTAGASLAALPAAAGTAAAGTAAAGTAAAGTAAAGAGTALASGATGAATGAAGTTAATGLGSKLLQGAKKIGVTDPKKTVGDMAQQASAQHTQNQQQIKQNNLEAAQNVADKAKEAAAVTKAWKFPNRLMHPEFAKFRKEIIESAKKAPHKTESHWNDRMGRGRPNEARYIPNQHFEHMGKQHNITPYQISYAMMEYLKNKGHIDEDNHDAVAIRELLHTDEPHPKPHQVRRGMEHIFSPIMEIGTLRGKSAHPEPVDPYGAKTQHINPIDVAEKIAVEESSRPPIQRRSVGIVREHLPSKRAFTPEDELVDSFSSKYENELAGKFKREDLLQQGVDYRTQKEYEQKQKQEEAARQAEQARQEEEAKQQELANQPVQVIPAGPGMYFVNGKLMTAEEAKASGYIMQSQPMDLAWRMLFKAGVEVHHQEPLPEEFTQDISLLDRNHQMNATENGTMIDNISPHMLRTIELMAQNYKDDENIEPKPFVMPTLRY